MLLARGHALIGFPVMQTRFARRPSAHRHADHDDFDPEIVARDLDGIVRVDEAGRLHPFPVDVHETAADGVSGLRTALEQPCKPQPLVDAQPVCALVWIAR